MNHSGFHLLLVLLKALSVFCCTDRIDGSIINCCPDSGSCLSSDCSIFGRYTVLQDCSPGNCVTSSCNWIQPSCVGNQANCYGFSPPECSPSGICVVYPCVFNGISSSFKICKSMDCVWDKWSNWAACRGSTCDVCQTRTRNKLVVESPDGTCFGEENQEFREPWLPVTFVGSVSGGAPFQFPKGIDCSEPIYEVYVEKFTFYFASLSSDGKSRLTGLTVCLSDDSSPITIGNDKSWFYYNFAFALGEIITELQIVSDNIGVLSIRFKTNLQEQTLGGWSDIDGGIRSVLVGTGLIYGVQGRAGLWIDNLGFYFAKP